MHANSFSESLTYHLGRRQFMLALSIAAALHVMGLIVYLVAPHETVVTIPVRALSLKLGGGDELEAISAGEFPDALPANNDEVENSLGGLLATPKDADVPASGRAGLNALEAAIARKATKIARDTVERKYVVADDPEAPHQYIRERDPSKSKAGSELGTSEQGRDEVLAHYEQAISSWIQKFKIYPTDARKLRLTGDAVLRVRIDRRGNIRYNVLESSTGHAELDRAAIEMVRRANPVPAVPVNYPAGEIIEFLIPVSFRLQ